MSAVLNSIFQSHRRSLLGTVMRIVRDRQTAEDVAQEAYLKARQALDTRSVEHVESFLYQTARNLALDHKRRTKVRRRYEIVNATSEDIENVALDVPSAEDTIIERQRQAAYEAALLQMPVRARTAWALSQIEGRTYAEIADHLNVSRNTVYNDIKLVMGHCRDVLARLDRNQKS